MTKKKISEESGSDFFKRVIDAVQLIPFGRVTTYGSIAKAVGSASAARTVGWALNSCAGRSDIPCHRVVNRLGNLSGAAYFGTPTMMRELLEAENIDFIDEAVNMKKHFYEMPQTD
ncbi:MAG: MGMT family protein [Candidatus Kapabacteria bacterium]|jgi:methylated-DNA-protein-cysteine methyltransferase-like protein|nr:MGMT family protein [Candidatus Kapabacteria bacterium]